MISTPGCSLNQFAKVDDSRSGNKSTGRCRSRSTNSVPYRCPFWNAQSSCDTRIIG